MCGFWRDFSWFEQGSKGRQKNEPVLLCAGWSNHMAQGLDRSGRIVLQYAFCEEETGIAMTDKQIGAGLDFLAGWLDKASVGRLLVGMFQPAHMFGGMVGSAICFLGSASIRILGAK